MDYRRRILDDELDELLAALAAVAIDGPKAVGKTATALQRATTIFELDDLDQRSIAEADPGIVVGAKPTVLIDEWQHVPATWDKVRRAVDAGAHPGQFVLTGSATSPPGTGTHSGGGRIVSVRMHPLSLAERAIAPPTVSLKQLLAGERADLTGETTYGLADYTHEILASGFPGLRDLSGRALRAALDGYLTRIVDRDFPELGHTVRNPAALRRWMAAYAAAVSTTATWETIRDAATRGEQNKPARATIAPYRDILERLFIVDPVPAWKPTLNHIAELGLPPKHQLADPALAARLLGATDHGLLRGEAPGPSVPRDGTLLGALFESLVTLSVRVYAQASEATVGHLRMHRGDHEIDLIVERDDGRVVAIEVKLNPTPPTDSLKHLKWLAGEIGSDLLDSVVITAGSRAYRRPDGIAVVPAALLGP